MAEYHAGMQHKNAFGVTLYLLSVPLAYVSIYASFFIFALIPAMYFLPEKKLAKAQDE
jgi:Gpi18-like mannosyltransferase